MAEDNWHLRHLNVSFGRFNCWQLAGRVYKTELDIKLAPYAREYDLKVIPVEVGPMILKEAERNWIKVDSLKDAKVFDIFVFWVSDPKDPSHIGVYLGKNDYMLTTTRSTGSRVEHINDWVRRKRLVGIWRHPELAESDQCPQPSTTQNDSPDIFG